MSVLVLLAAIAVLGACGFALARGRALAAVESGGARLHSLPVYYGWYGALWTALPGIAVIALWLAVSPSLLPSLALPPGAATPEDPAQRELFWNDVENLARGSFSAELADDAVRTTAERYVALRGRALLGAFALTVLLGLAGGAIALRRIRPALAARVQVERVLRGVLLLSSTLAILVTIGIVLSLVFETLRFFETVSPREFLFGTEWSPQTALRADQVASAGSFGAVPIFVGTLLITAIAMVVAVPIGLLSAIHMTFYASARARDVLKPLLEILAGVPTVVYGFFAALVVAPAVRDLGAGARPVGGLGECARRGPGDGDHDRAVHLVALRRRDHGRADLAARRLVRTRRDALGDDPARDHPGRAARHRRRIPARGVARDRRDDDRGDGRGPRGEPVVQSARRRHDGDGADRHAPHRRPGVRQPEDARRLCARADALRRDARAECRRAADREALPGKI